MEKKYEYGDKLRTSKYAQLKGVTPARVSQLKKSNKLKTSNEHGIELVLHCKENDLLFDNPSHNSKRKGGES